MLYLLFNYVYYEFYKLKIIMLWKQEPNLILKYTKLLFPKFVHKFGEDSKKEKTKTKTIIKHLYFKKKIENEK